MRQLKLFLCFVLMMFGMTANAAVITYKFDSGSYFEFDNNNSYAPTGIFKFDDVLNQVSFVDVYEIQTSLGATGPFHFTTAVTNSVTNVVFIDQVGDNTGFFFEHSLATGGTIRILSGSYSVNGTVFPVNVGGSVTAVPEPESTTILLAGLALIGGVVRRKKR